MEEVFVFGIKRDHFEPMGKKLLDRPKALLHVHLRKAGRTGFGGGAALRAARADFGRWPGAFFVLVGHRRGTTGRSASWPVGAFSRAGTPPPAEQKCAERTQFLRRRVHSTN